MVQKTPIRFLYTLRGVDCEFEVVKPYGDHWLCRVVSGPMIGEELVFHLETIKVGEMLLRALAANGVAV